MAYSIVNTQVFLGKVVAKKIPFCGTAVLRPISQKGIDPQLLNLTYRLLSALRIIATLLADWLLRFVQQPVEAFAKETS